MSSKRRDERVAEAVGMYAIDLAVGLADQPGRLGEITEQAVDSSSVAAATSKPISADSYPGATVLPAPSRWRVCALDRCRIFVR